MDLRPIDPNNEAEVAAVLALFRLVFGREMSPAFYKWRFLENPFGPPMVSLLWDGATLAGHYAASAVRIYADGERLGAQSMTTMTHPRYRGQGVFPKLAEHLFDRLVLQGIAMVWGLPNVNSHLSFVQKLGWRNVGPLVTMTKNVGHASAKGPHLLPETVLDDDVTRLCKDSLDGRIWAGIRDTQYLRWRYLENPISHYRFIKLADGEVFLVVKNYETQTGLALEVVDLLYGKHPRAMDVALRELTATLNGAYTMIRSWVSMDDPVFASFEKHGFIPKEPIAYFGARPLGSFSIREEQWSLSHWRIAMGDSDNF